MWYDYKEICVPYFGEVGICLGLACGSGARINNSIYGIGGYNGQPNIPGKKIPGLLVGRSRYKGVGA